MKQVIWTAPHDVTSLVLTHQKRLGLVGLLQILQDVAWAHADHLGHGFGAMLERGTLWVLTRFVLRAQGPWPEWGERLDVNTWVRKPTGAIAMRDYEVVVGGRRFAEATASWLTLDLHTRRPLKIALGDEALAFCRTEGTWAEDPAKLRGHDGLSEIDRVRVRTSDLDINGHVNNTHYAQWILDALPLPVLDASPLTHYEVNFLAESRLGDTVILEGTLPEAGGAWESPFQGRRADDDKPVFVALLKAGSPA
ncbi:acyl-[acyl-carrier-protein] thioesterase [Pararhodospirillum oryzae]|uniref:Acyl-ACP thioesterase n=1 Tax=Pararhodospirillum oryzae TaxID=478448 RepID=A0A512H4Q5_9PROT|nr:acyl-ACP thioesterase domain-containing protein [Pararhodospirillum oryzae]GEO80360.1 acyl-ACP thioesterase [Pararhodospirillum oryzae]